MKPVIAALVAAGLTGVSVQSVAQESGWQRTVSQMIAAKHNYPRSAQIRGHEGTARVRVSVDGSGNVTRVDLIEGSGSDILDREAIKISESVKKVPAPPGNSPIHLVVPISWKLT